MRNCKLVKVSTAKRQDQLDNCTISLLNITKVILQISKIQMSSEKYYCPAAIGLKDG